MCNRRSHLFFSIGNLGIITYLFLSTTAAHATTLNVLSFGASGNGSTNDTSPLQAALDACASGDTVFIPSGTYMTDPLYLRLGCNVKGDRGASTLKARTARQGSLLYANDANRNSTIEDLVFDMNNLADTAVKFDWQVQGAVIRYNVFKNGGSAGAIFVPSGTSASDRNTSIDHNIFQNILQGISSYNKLSNTNVDWNYFDTFEQGLSAGGCSDAYVGNYTTIDHNTFLQGRRMAIEVCGRWDNLSASYNYLTNWRPSLTPNSENYAACGSSYPYMCDSMGISLAIGGAGTTASHNRIYRQPGTSWGIEYTVRQPPDSNADDNIIKNAGISLFDDACYYVGGTANCTATRLHITNNYGCGGNATANTDIFGNWPASNYYFSSCTDPRFPAEDPIPPMPFSLTGSTPPNQAPQVALTSPSGGASFPSGTAISVSASASDPDGSVSKVEFFRNGALMATATTAPYSYSWTNAAAGSYTLSARATDNAGATANSASVTVTILAANKPPQVSFTSPVSGATLYAPATILMSANATDTDGSIAKVEFLRGTTVLATTTAAPYTYSWTNVAAGSYTLTARATDNAGAATTSAPVTVTVSTATSTSPSPVFYKGINLNGPAVTVEGNAWTSYSSALSSGLSVQNGTLWAGTYSFTPSPTPDAGTNIALQSSVFRPGTTNGTGFSLLQTVPKGTYQVYVWTIENFKANSRSIDLKLEGAIAAQAIGDLPYGTWKKYGPYTTTVSDGVLNVDVLRGTKGDPGLVGIAIYSVPSTLANQPPQVALTSPSAGATFTTGATVSVSAGASDADGSVSKVEFLNGTTLLATVTAAPYSYSWTNVAGGNYTLTARATDNAGAVTTSAPVSITVSATPTPVFYKGINLNGPATSVEGNAWLSYTSALASGLTVLNANLWAGSYTFTASPVADAGTAAILGSAVWRPANTNGTGFSLLQAVPNGTYQVYVWAIENFNSNYRSMDLKLEGVTAVQGIGDLPYGTWKKYGPYTTTVSDGVLNIDVLRGTKGDPGLIGMAIYSVK